MWGYYNHPLAYSLTVLTPMTPSRYLRIKPQAMTLKSRPLKLVSMQPPPPAALPPPPSSQSHAAPPPPGVYYYHHACVYVFVLFFN